MDKYFSANHLHFMRITLLIVICLLSTSLLAQDARKNLYLELGGNGMAFNVMYESRFKPGTSGAGFKIGAGGFSTAYENLFTIPAGVNWLFTRDGKNYFEAGFGATFLHYDDKYNYYYSPGGPTYEEYPVDVVNLTVDSKNSVYGHLALGYRRQPTKGGIMYGIAITPHFNQNGVWPLWVGLKFGYSFPDKSDRK